MGRPTGTMGDGLGEAAESLFQHGADGFHFGCVPIFAARPEESPQAVLFAAGHDVDMQMGDALADFVVDRDERSLGTQALFHGSSEEAGLGKKRLQDVGGEVCKGLVMRSGDEQAMSGEEGPVVEKGKAQFRLPDYGGSAGTGHDFTEQTRGGHVTGSNGQAREPAYL